jgi:hypothetical protein
MLKKRKYLKIRHVNDEAEIEEAGFDYKGKIWQVKMPR